MALPSLPPGSKYSLITNEADPSKRAIIVKLSSATLDAIDPFKHQTIDFEFGDNPGIHIGDKFFPMRCQKEDIRHELYHRTKQNRGITTAMKLCAPVSGKLTVADKELGKDVSDRIRQRTIDVAEQRSNRRTILIDTPSDLPPTNSRKRKDAAASSMFRKPVRQNDQAPRPIPAASAPPTRVASPATFAQAPAKDANVAVRRRLIHYLALAERTAEATVKAVGGSSVNDSLRDEILKLLAEVAEQNPAAAKKSADKSQQRGWRLKPRSYLETRPYEWPKLSDAERLTITRAARQACAQMGIPESDPVWEHFRFRGPGASGSAVASPAGHSRTASTSQTQKDTPPPKRGVSSKEAKEKKAKPKGDPKGVILMKDESRPAPKATPTHSSKVESESINSTATSSSRKPPGSGFKLGKAPSQEHQAGSVDPSSARQPKRPDVRAEGQTRASLGASTASAQERRVSPLPQQRVKKIRESNGVDSEREKQERIRDMRDAKREKEKEKERERDPVPQGRPAPSKTKEGTQPSTKRKKPLDDTDGDYDSRPQPNGKRRKTEDTAELVTSSSTSKARARDLSLPKKPEMPLPSRPQQIKKESSPLPPPRTSLHPPPPRASHTSASPSPRRPPPRASHTSVSPAPHRPPQRASHASVSPAPSLQHRHGREPSINVSERASNSGSRRRRSPIYTSSEDEVEKRVPRRAISPRPLPTPPTTTPSSLSSRSHTTSRPLPGDHAALRARYNSSYMEYIQLFQKMHNQRYKTESLLNKIEDESVASITDSDGDVEMLDPDALGELVADYNRLKDELESIQTQVAV